jgi:hypothetical protein
MTEGLVPETIDAGWHTACSEYTCSGYQPDIPCHASFDNTGSIIGGMSEFSAMTERWDASGGVGSFCHYPDSLDYHVPADRSRLMGKLHADPAFTSRFPMSRDFWNVGSYLRVFDPMLASDTWLEGSGGPSSCCADTCRCDQLGQWAPRAIPQPFNPHQPRSYITEGRCAEVAPSAWTSSMCRACADVTYISVALASNGGQLSWRISSDTDASVCEGGPYSSGPDQQFRRGVGIWAKAWGGLYNYRTGVVHEQCCLAPGNYTLTCMASDGAGWSPEGSAEMDSHLDIAGQAYCADFTRGSARSVAFAIRDRPTPTYSEGGEFRRENFLPPFESATPVTCEGVQHFLHGGSERQEYTAGPDGGSMSSRRYEDIAAHDDSDRTSATSLQAGKVLLPLGSVYRPQAWYAFAMQQQTWMAVCRLLCVRPHTTPSR